MLEQTPAPTVALTTYRSPRLRAQWAIITLLLIIIANIVGIAADLTERDLLQRMRDREYFTLEEAEASDDRQATIGFVEIGVFFGSVITFLSWFYLTRLNLDAFGIQGTEFTPRWTWLGFIIPIINLIRPYKVAAEIWKASSPYAQRRSTYSWQRSEAGTIVKAWWGVWIVMNMLSRVVLRAYRENDTVEQMLTSNFGSIISSGFEIFSALVTIMFIWRLTQRQDNTHAHVSSHPAAMAAAMAAADPTIPPPPPPPAPSGL